MKLVKRETLLVIRDANKSKLIMKGTLKLKVQLGPFALEFEIIVYETLAVPLILGGDLCDQFVEAIYPQLRYVVDVSQLQIDCSTTISQDR